MFRSARARRKQAAPEATSTLIDSTLKFLRLDDKVRGMRAMRAFDAVVGPRIRSRARAERLRGRVLHICVASSAWSQELHVMRATILEKLKATPGGELVDELRFQVGDVNELPSWTTPAMEPPVADMSQSPQMPPPTDALLAAVQQIPDDELRARFATLVGKAAKKA